MDSRRVMGQYMTPDAIAAQMCQQIQRPVLEWRVLDPASGDGNLLLAATRIMKKAGVQEIHKRIFGVEIDPALAAEARHRIAAEIGCDLDDVQVICGDFLGMLRRRLFPLPHFGPEDYNTVLANPPYGDLREYMFFQECAQVSLPGTEIVFLVPLSFLDRVTGVDFIPLPGRPMEVTPGHAIIHYVSGQPYHLRSVRGLASNHRSFSVLTGIKLYELGAGQPPQTKDITEVRPFSSDTFRPGWLPCLRTGDIHPFRATIGRLWVDYGPHLAHPKNIERFQGSRIFVRRIPIWQSRQLGAAYLEETALCAGDVLVVRHISNDPELLKGLCVYLNSPEAAELVLTNRPSLRYRTSFPKVSAKDLHVLFEAMTPTEGELRAMADPSILHEVRQVAHACETSV